MRIHRTLIITAALALIAMPAAAQKMTGSHPAGAIPAPMLMDTTGLFFQRFAKVGDDLYISGQPTENGLRELKKRGVTVVVNLRTPPEMARIGFDEPKLIEELGMKYVYLPVRGDSTAPYSPATVASFAKVMQEATGPVALHCTIAWRASHLYAAYLIKYRGVEVDKALAAGNAINMSGYDPRTPGRQPVEAFLDRDIPTLKHTPAKP